MKVQGPGRPGVGQIQPSPSHETGQLKSSESKAKLPEERIQVSSLSKLLSDAKLAGAEVKDADKVASLKAALAEQSFKVDTDRVAEAMLREER